VVKLLVIKVVT